ncbi:MAG: M23 family metallopeptidase, partial [Candidatus Aegiribacteria sp.]|nr:M23 family metallopeptidase [Candidatus Aegiribacteria sp.]
MNVILLIGIVAVTAVSLYANDPTVVPWPVGSTLGEMNQTKTIMNSYGDPNGSWANQFFHCGIDIDEQSASCDEVRCVHGNEALGEFVVVSKRLEGFSKGYSQWVVVTTEGTDSLNHEDYGWCYQHLFSPYPPIWDTVSVGDLIAVMHPQVAVPHVHFKWTTWDYNEWCYVNPLNYLDTAPNQGDHFDWIFNPDGYPNDFESFFLIDDIPDNWSDDPNVVFNDTLDRSALGLDVVPYVADVDLFFGFSLLGRGDNTHPDWERNDLAPERIQWNIIRETSSRDITLTENYVVNFDCPLSWNSHDISILHYFRLDLDELYSHITGEYEGLITCLTNCGDMQGWENLGIDNIEENCWDTNIDYQFSDDATNPILAAYKDGPYLIDVTCSSHGDPAVEFEQSINCELHNFAPVVEEVIVSGSTGEIYHAEWTASGLTPQLNVTVDIPVSNSEILDVTVIFSEPM